ncbi:NAD(P)/FAD-dependent oxidoreductase [Microlunatus sp. Gsoil 973]|uniref:NAD(P)/FAD-dependent oxidoreductase n=1 Tax=Microlunatus sp. Gsoil 973 TaxID=2672569 RepID=UPI0012B4E529|nr:NAD(P)/FAD-dependent oxidoreductase [Microlunatus sp. Gsoil 973]QGN32868.1 NAD(P)/FAD-dependent oxidoreductase [Microlunatus sp. Gsoil 973]
MNAPNTLNTPADSYDYLIIGGGMVADNAAKAIQDVDPNGSVGIISSDPDEPVTRPALTKKLWTDPDFEFEEVWLKTVEQTGAQLITGVTVDSVDPARHRITAGGNTVGYRRLLLATGGEPTRLDLPEDDRVIHFRSVDDYRRLRELSGNGRQVAVVGGGYIGTELAAGLSQNDTKVIMIFPQELIYAEKFPRHLAEHLTDLYRQHGIDLRPQTRITGGETGPDGVRLSTESGDGIDADAVVVGLGVTPRTELAEKAGLEVDDGVIVDEFLTTSDPDILAAGDIASYPDAILGRQRVEHVDNANAMGTQAGRNLAGAHERYDYTPYFYSELFGNRYEAVGSLDASAETVESWDGDHERGVVYYLDGRGGVAGVLLWNVEDQTDRAREVIKKSGDREIDRDLLRNAIPLG